MCRFLVEGTTVHQHGVRYLPENGCCVLPDRNVSLLFYHILLQDMSLTTSAWDDPLTRLPLRCPALFLFGETKHCGLQILHFVSSAIPLFLCSCRETPNLCQSLVGFLFIRVFGV